MRLYLAIAFITAVGAASAHYEGVTRSAGAVLSWNSAALQSIRDSNLGAPMVSRALAVVHTCMYDAWAAYDERAVGTQLLRFSRTARQNLVRGN